MKGRIAAIMLVLTGCAAGGQGEAPNEADVRTCDAGTELMAMLSTRQPGIFDQAARVGSAAEDAEDAAIARAARGVALTASDGEGRVDYRDPLIDAVERLNKVCDEASDR